MRRPFHSRFVAIGLVCLGSVVPALGLGCGSSEQPEAYPGQPINPPSKEDDLLDLMTGTGEVASAEPTPLPTAPTATATAAATATARPTPSAAATAKPKPAKTAAPTAPHPSPTPKATSNEMAPKK